MMSYFKIRPNYIRILSNPTNEQIKLARMLHQNVADIDVIVRDENSLLCDIMIASDDEELVAAIETILRKGVMK